VNERIRRWRRLPGSRSRGSQPSSRWRGRRAGQIRPVDRHRTGRLQRVRAEFRSGGARPAVAGNEARWRDRCRNA